MPAAWLPNSGLIREHHDYGIWCTDAPPIYHVAAMLTSIAAVCADTARLVVDNHPYPLHVWSMLIGDSTSDRKTTASRLAISRIESISTERVQRIYGSPEGILQSLVIHPCITLYVPEGGAFFAQREASYWKHARDIFMDLYDYTTVFERRLVKETIKVKNPRISILAACAFPLLERYTRDTDWLGGFLARFLLIAGRPLPFKQRMRTDPKVEAGIEQQINNIFKKPWGNMAMTTGARRVLDDFSTEIHNEATLFPPGIAPSLNRLPETANRLAALYEIASHAASPPPSGVVLVKQESAACAAALCRASRDEALTRVGGLTEKSGVSRELSELETLIRRTGLGGMTRSELIRRLRIHARDLDKLLHTLSEAELIEYVVARSGNAGRPTTRFVHAEAKADVQRIQQQAQQTVQAAWVDLSGAEPPCLDNLPAFNGVPLGVAHNGDDDDDDDGGRDWN